jgi:hypothetical protein
MKPSWMHSTAKRVTGRDLKNMATKDLETCASKSLIEGYHHVEGWSGAKPAGRI